MGRLIIGLVTVTGQVWADPAVLPGAGESLTAVHTPEFDVQLSQSSQTVAALRPTGADGFDFAPGDRLALRRANGFHHLGDLTLRLRSGDAEPWRDYDTATARQPVTPLPAAGQTLAAADLTPTLPPDCPLRIVRTWALDGTHIVLRFDLTNRSAQPVEIGGLDLPMVFNNLITDRTLEQAHAVCSFSDPYMGSDGGYLQVTRLSGQGPALVVTPLDHTPFEAYRPLDEPMPRQQTFEGMLAWTVHSKAYAERDWHGARPWNPPTSETLAPGQTRTCGVKFLVALGIRDIEKTLADNGRPVAVGIPGYVLPTDLDARLFLKYPSEVASVTVDPPDALAIRRESPTPGGWQVVALRGQAWGRARLDITYKDGTRQTVHYHVIKPAAQAVADLGHFLTTKQWFDDATDPFKRSPSVIGYDRDANRPVTQERRVWIAGLSDEGGAGSWLAAALKESGQPDPAEVAKLERFVDEVLWGTIQFRDGDRKWGVRKSAFFYEPKTVPGFAYDPNIRWKGWECWDRQGAEDIHRPFNYPHVVAAYWSMYRVARNHPGMVTNHPWQWYLTQAFETTNFLVGDDGRENHPLGFQALGLMEGSVFLQVIEDLRHEGWTAQADALERGNKKRADHWKTERYPFGSEMAWDSTGQEEVYTWCRHFGYRDKALVTLDAILGYMPTVPHWGYNGNARRYWDFLYAGKLSRIERQIHHYGSAINAIPVLTEFRDHPDDFYLLRVGYGGTMGALTNIDQEGFASAAFHSFPSTLRWDAYSGDYGSNFYGHATNAATYVVDHPEFGWQVFGGNVRVDGEQVVVEPRDSFRQRIYIAPLGLWLTLDAGTFRAVTVGTRTRVVRVDFDPGTADVATARLRVEQPAALPGVGAYGPPTGTATRGGAWEVPLGKDGASLELAVTAASDAQETRASSIRHLDPPELGFFAKQLDFEGLPIKAPDVVSDDALVAAYGRLQMMFEHFGPSRSVILRNLAKGGIELHIIGRHQVTTDLPEWRQDKGKRLSEYNGLTRDERTRGMGGKLVSCGEENLLRLPDDVYRGRDICVHEFAHVIFRVGIPPALQARFDEQYHRSLAAGRWVGAYAASNLDEFFAELSMWYFGTHGDLQMAGAKPRDGREGLRAYDPDAYALFDEFYGGRASL